MGWAKTFKRNKTDELAEALVSNAHSCTEQIMAGLRPVTKKERDTIWYQVLCEFLFCFLHLTDRLAFSVLGAEKRSQLLTPLGELVAKLHVETYLGHWPADMKTRIESEFIENLDNAQIEYSSCTELISEDKPFSKDAVISRLAFNVAEITGNPNDIAELVAPTELAVSAVAEMNLRQLIENTTK
jgi:hypothetical protein